jgi:hypothetical protein
MGWSGLTNGALLKNAAEEFDVFLTADSNLSFQQNLGSLELAVIVLRARSTRLVDTIPLMRQVADVLETIQPGDVVRLEPVTSD